MSLLITQIEYESLMQLLKEFKERNPLSLKEHWSREIIAPETGDSFMLDFYNGRIEFKKFSINKRYRNTIILIRYCSHGVHTNPDGIQFTGSHLHLYKEGFDDKFAVGIGTIGATSSSTIVEVLEKFLDYCKIQRISISATLL